MVQSMPRILEGGALRSGLHARAANAEDRSAEDSNTTDFLFSYKTYLTNRKKRDMNIPYKTDRK